MFRKGYGKAAAVLDVAFNGSQDFFERRMGYLLLERVHARKDRNACVHHGGELACKNNDLLAFDLFTGEGGPFGHRLL
ncbi:hypothetical protein D3C83_151310 [compost metagenome]